MPAASELIAHGRTEDEVADFIGADWLVYQSLDDLIHSVRHENADIEAFDTSCFSGEYVTGDVTHDYLRRVEANRADSAKEARENRVADIPNKARVV